MTMEGLPFDHLARAISPGGTRRRLLGALAGVTLGGLFSVLEHDATEARRKRHGRRRSHRPGRRKDNRKGLRGGNGGDLGRTPACIPVNVAGDCPASGNCGCPGGPFIPCVNGHCIVPVT
jgi:hypothetical protein